MQASRAIIFLYPAGILDGLAQIFPLYLLVAWGFSSTELLSIYLRWRKRARVFKDVRDGIPAASPTVFFMQLSKNEATPGKERMSGSQDAFLM